MEGAVHLFKRDRFDSCGCGCTPIPQRGNSIRFVDFKVILMAVVVGRRMPRDIRIRTLT